MRFLVLLFGLAAALGGGERSMPVEPAGKATTDCTMADILAGTCGDTADPTLDEVPDGYVAPEDSTAGAAGDSKVTEEVVADTVETEGVVADSTVTAAADSTVSAPDTIERTQIADPFNIQIEYRHEGGPVFTAEDKAAIERAARRWEKVIVEGFADTTAYLKVGEEYRQVYVDDFHLVVGAWAWDDADRAHGRGGPRKSRESEIPLSGEIELYIRTAGRGAESMYHLALHEIGHALGLVGVWSKRTSAPDYWLRPAFVSRFGVTDGVFFKTSEIEGHFNLPGDVMVFDGPWSTDVTSLSAAVLEDMGYRVDYAAVEEWRMPYGPTALKEAAFFGLLEVVKYLVGQGAQTTWIVEGRTALHWAAKRGNLEVVKYLVGQGASLTAKNRFGQTALHEAAGNCHPWPLTALGNPVPMTALHEAAGNCHLCSDNLEVVKYLVGQGVSVTATDNVGRTALYWAAFVGNKAAVEYLVGQGVSVTATDKDGKTAKDYASANGETDVVAYLNSVGG